MSAARFSLLVAGVFAVAATLYIAAFVVGWAQPLGRPEPLRDIHRVKSWLASRAPSPRWLIVGGSSAWFGFDSGLLARAARQPVVNLGTHAEVPLWFQLEEAERHARPGDTVLLAAELVHFWRERPTTYGVLQLGPIAPDLLAQTNWTRRWDLLGAVPPSHVFARLLGRVADGSRLAGPSDDELIRELRAYWAGARADPMPGYYSYLELNEHGDFARPRTAREHERDDYGLAKPSELTGRLQHDLTSVRRRLHAKGVACLFTWPPFEQHEGVALQSASAQTNLARIRSHLTAAGWREVGSPEDALFAPAFFYDTAYHLTIEGARERTLRFVARARQAGILPPP